jgi:hypothetical protein
MVHGYPLVKHLCGGLQAFMAKHNFSSIDEFRGAALPYFTTHTDLVARQKAAIAERKAGKVGLANDQAWTGEWCGHGRMQQRGRRPQGVPRPLPCPPVSAPLAPRAQVTALWRRPSPWCPTSPELAPAACRKVSPRVAPD